MPRRPIIITNLLFRQPINSSHTQLTSAGAESVRSWETKQHLSQSSRNDGWQMDERPLINKGNKTTSSAAATAFTDVNRFLAATYRSSQEIKANGRNGVHTKTEKPDAPLHPSKGITKSVKSNRVFFFNLILQRRQGIDFRYSKKANVEKQGNKSAYAFKEKSRR